MDGYCTKCNGIGMLVVGIIFLLNTWLKFMDWWMLIGVLLVLGGLARVVWPSCGCGDGCCMPAAPAKKKR